MPFPDLIAALLLPVPPWLGFWLFRRRGRVGLSFGYFLGGILTVLAIPWSSLVRPQVPTPQLGAALFGFTLFLQAQREGVQGLRRLAVGVGGSTGILLLLLLRLHLPLQELAHFWIGALLELLLWLLFSDLAYRLARGRQLEVRMPLVGAATLGLGALAQAFLPAAMPRLSWSAAQLSGLLLGLVALQQLRWLRSQGAWVEGRGEGLRLALALLDKKQPGEAPALSLGLEPSQPILLVDSQGQVLESNGPFSQLAGLPRHRLRGYLLDAIFQGGERSVWTEMQEQLLRYGCGALQATLVSEDGTFRQVGLEASTFDRGMALVWLSDGAEGSLRLSGGGLPEGGGAEEARRLRANAVLALSAAVGGIRAGATGAALQAAARQAATAAARLDPSPDAQAKRPSVEAKAALERVEGRLRALAPASPLGLDVAPLTLAVDSELLERIATHLALHALEGQRAARLTLTLELLELGRRSFGVLHVRKEWAKSQRPGTLFGLSWLRQAVLETGGLLELDQDAQGDLNPRVYLPVAGPPAQVPWECALQDLEVWVVDQDPLARAALLSLVEGSGGRALAFGDLRGMLRSSRGLGQPDVLVLERTGRLDRFHRSMRAFQKEPVPTLVLGLGHPLPLNPAALGLTRLGFLEKPFRPEAFLESVKALLHRPEDGEAGLL